MYFTEEEEMTEHIHISQDDPSAREELPVFDRSDLLLRMMDNEELVKVVLDAFMADASSLIQDIEQAETGNDAEALTMAAHSLKGAAANISALRLSDLSAKIEMAARDNDLATAGKLVPLVRSSFEKLKEVVVS
jgi:HPt (histidine-containing phosphotransfer) domain-containing protein